MPARRPLGRLRYLGEIKLHLKVITYIDGFNLYHGALENTPYKWLDVVMLGKHLMPRYDVVATKYFTSFFRLFDGTSRWIKKSDRDRHW